MPGGPCTMYELWLSTYLNFLKPPKERVRILVVNCTIKSPGINPDINFFDGVQTMLDKFSNFVNSHGKKPYEDFVRNCGLEVVTFNTAVSEIQSPNIEYNKTGKKNLGETWNENIRADEATTSTPDSSCNNTNTYSVFMGTMVNYLWSLPDLTGEISKLISDNIDTKCFKMDSYLNLEKLCKYKEQRQTK